MEEKSGSYKKENKAHFPCPSKRKSQKLKIERKLVKKK